jgi:methylenetetrahydrofolate--tRNA-(uracil-5-)-methyltransferase
MTRKAEPMPVINIIGAGLAGSEAAHIAALMGVDVRLYEMKPVKYSPAHHSDKFAELVCSNSLRADSVTNAVGLLKEELRIAGSLIMEAADKARVPAGGALAVDREEFAGFITDWIKSSDRITVINEEIKKIPDDDEITIIATGPLTDGDLFDQIGELCGDDTLHFFDAAAPIVMGSSIDMSKAFRASRYGKGGDDYINCPMNKDEYLAFYRELISAERAAVKDFDREVVFEGCMPIETMASRGEDTMRFGPLKPVGLIDPATGKEPYACLQLRQDDRAKTMYNLVGFQTRLKWDEQKRVFGMIPGLENAEYYRMGVMHRNTYLNSPVHLEDTYRFKGRKNLFFAGQITGVEGYIESTASGFLAGYYAALKALGKEVPFKPDADTVMGAMAAYVSDPNIKHFVPMNANFGIVAPMPGKFKGKDGKKMKCQAIADRSISKMAEFAGVLKELKCS